MLSPQSKKNVAHPLVPSTVFDITKSERMEEEKVDGKENEEKLEEYTDEVVIGFSIFEDGNDSSRKPDIHPSMPLLSDIILHPNQQTISPSSLQFNTGQGAQEVRNGREDKCAEDMKSTKPNTLLTVTEVSRKSTDRTLFIQPIKKSIKEVRESIDTKMKSLDEEKKYVDYCGKFLARVILNKNK